MKAQTFYQLRKGQGLMLKPDRADSYGIVRAQPQFFSHIQERQGYTVPWIVALGAGGLGHYKPSDFASISTEFAHEMNK